MSKEAMSDFETKEFKSLKQEWYNKLKDDGFEDLESYTNKTGYICNNPYTNSDIKNLYKFRSDMGEHYFADYQHQTFLYFSSIRSFLTLASHSLPFLDILILQLHSNGLSIRKIIKYLDTFLCRYPRFKYKGKLLSSYSVFYIHKRLKILKETVRLWNLSHDEGIKYRDYDEPEEK